MEKKAIDLQAIRQAEERLKQLLEEHPDLRDLERQDALAEWLTTLDVEDTQRDEQAGKRAGSCGVDGTRTSLAALAAGMVLLPLPEGAPGHDTDVPTAIDGEERNPDGEER